jgi:hypothetical protein
VFGRKKDAQGLYTGDAPVSAPGFDGAEPTAYHGSPAGSEAVGAGPTAASPFPPVAPSGMAAGAGPVSGMPPAPGFGPSGVPSGLPAGVPSGFPAGGAMPSDADLARLEQLLGQRVPPQFAGIAMEQIERLRAQGGPGPAHPGAVPFGASAWGPANSPGIASPGIVPGIAARPRKAGMVGCVVAVVVLAAVIAGVAGLIVTKVRDATSSTAGTTTPSRASVGVPVTATYDGATLSLTVRRALIQPGYPWAMSFSGAPPTLLVEVDMKRTDSGTDPVTVIGWDWHFTPDGGGSPITGDIIGEYQPDLTGPKLAGGESAHGWVSFGIAARTASSGTLSFSDSMASDPSVSWSIAATRAAPVTGTLGRPAQGVVSAPAFTVTVGNPRSVAAASDTVQLPAASGRYLLLDVAFAVSRDVSGIAGQIEDDTFVFTPSGGKPLTPTPGAVASSLDWTVLNPGTSPSGVVAFDTTATAGTLTMRDGAGNAVVTWTITPTGATAVGTAGRSTHGTAAVTPPKTAPPKTTPPKTTPPKTAPPKTAPPKTTPPKTTAGGRTG